MKGKIISTLIILTLALLTYFSTRNKVKTEERDLPTYDEFLIHVNYYKKHVKNTQNYFFELINEKVPLYWNGTKWAFGGTTLVPQQGTIACGYFITNNLYNLGFEINRFKLAQEPSSYLINELCEKQTIKRFSSINKMYEYIHNQPKNDVFIVGLDFHTGFLTKSENDLFFIHSDYINKEGVKKELAKESRALNTSKSFMVGSLLQNEDLLDKWKNNSK